MYFVLIINMANSNSIEMDGRQRKVVLELGKGSMLK